MEYEDVAKRPGMLPHLTTVQIDAILNQICAGAIEQRIYFSWRPFLPDPDDDMLVELALAAQASYIVTSNLRDLHPATQLGLRVIEPRDFLVIIESL